MQTLAHVWCAPYLLPGDQLFKICIILLGGMVSTLLFTAQVGFLEGLPNPENPKNNCS